ncbi:nucleoside phosphatase family-domain-containing protein [Rhizoctonia solani]|nr:nucleoside phosphatase family-domain-containing protein [Rhizoctonia solani]
MPPPTASNAWLASRRFGIVIDAGSSGSRLQIYSWKDPRTVRAQPGSPNHGKLPKIEKGTIDGEDWVMKVEPGLSTFGDRPSGVAAYLRPLLAHALVTIPPSLHSQTPIFLLATAGMRLLHPTQQRDVLREVCDFLRFHSNFKVDDSNLNSGLGVGHGCGSSVRIISGEEEGLFGWLAVNYLMDGFDMHLKSKSVDPSHADGSTYGFLDMGGASTQIAYEPSHKQQELPENNDSLVDVRLRLLGGDEIRHRVFVTTWLGYGTNQARERYVEKVINGASTADPDSVTQGTTDLPVILDPCLPANLTRREKYLDSKTSITSRTLLGTGSFNECLAATEPLLNKNVPCPDSRSCLFNGVPAPPIDFSVSRFIGVSEYWYSSENVFGLGGGYDFVQYERAASTFCGQSWGDLVAAHDKTKLEHGKEGLGGDGHTEKHGEIVDVGQWGRNVELKRLEMQCFKAAWIVNVLHEGIGIPRIVDSHGNSTDQDTGVSVSISAEEKGLGQNRGSKKSPTFQSMETVNDTAISWTLGKMVVEACKDIPPASKQAIPIADPMQPVPQIPPSKPGLWDFDALEDSISHRLPQRLTRHSLGFSPIAFAFYSTVLLTCLYMFWRMRPRLRTLARRWRRTLYPTEQTDRMQYAMESGYTVSSPMFSRPGTPSFPSSHNHSAKITSALRTSLRDLTAPIQRAASPFQNRRTSSFPPANGYESGNGSGSPATPPTARPYHLSVNTLNSSRSSAPSPNSPAILSSGLPKDATSNSLQTPIYSLSRNSSSVNLTTIVPRTSAAMSRQTTNGHTPTSSMSDD